MVKALVVGCKGQLGWELMTRCGEHDITAIGVDLPEYDVSDYAQIHTLMNREQPDCVVNASAYTAVDQAEDNMETAFQVNRDGPLNLAGCCSELNIPLIHVSTDYVFNGRSNKPYDENDPVSPLGVYGKSKEAGECEIRRLLPRHTIIRTSWLYGVHGNNFVKTMLRLGKEREQLSVVNDQFGCPTCASDLAEAILEIVTAVCKSGTQAWGTYHYCGDGVVSWFEFAERIFQYAKKHTVLKISRVVPIPTREYPTPAERPMYSALSCKKINETFNIKTAPWEKSLECTIRTILDEYQNT